MYRSKLYIPFDDLNTYIHNCVDERYKDLTFIPVKVEVNEVDLSIDISLLAADSIESDDRRYKVDLNALLVNKATKPCSNCALAGWNAPHCKICVPSNNFQYFAQKENNDG